MKSGNGTPQLQICSALLQKGPMNRKDLGVFGEEVGLSSAQISSALNNAKSHKRVTCDADGVYGITELGTTWLQAETGEREPPRTTARASRKTARRRAAKRKEVDTSPTEDEDDGPTFLCSVISNGSFWLSKGDAEITLTKEEHAEMLHYLERMAAPEAS